MPKMSKTVDMQPGAPQVDPLLTHGMRVLRMALTWPRARRAPRKHAETPRAPGSPRTPAWFEV